MCNIPDQCLMTYIPFCRMGKHKFGSRSSNCLLILACRCIKLDHIHPGCPWPWTPVSGVLYQESFQEELTQTMEEGAQWFSKIVKENGIEDDFPVSEIFQVRDVGRAMFEVCVCEMRKLECWAYTYAVLATFYLFTWAPVINALRYPLLAQCGWGGRLIASAFKGLATSVCASFSACAALQLNPAAADPISTIMLQAYQMFDREFPFLRALRWANLVAVLACCAGLAARLWPA